MVYCYLHAWNWSNGRHGFLWLRKGGYFWCYYCGAKRTLQEMNAIYRPDGMGS